MIKGFKKDEIPLMINGIEFKYVCPWCGNELNICKGKMYSKDKEKMGFSKNDVIASVICSSRKTQACITGIYNKKTILEMPKIAYQFEELLKDREKNEEVLDELFGKYYWAIEKIEFMQK